MKIMHLEASPGWGGQELRILRESEGMRLRGHDVILVVQKGGGLVEPARKAGFTVYEVQFEKKRSLGTIFSILKWIRKHQIDLLNTHSSLDSWIGGIAGKLAGKPVIRTRHLSTAIKPGLNSYLLYNALADFVVTTCQAVVPLICKQAKLPLSRCRSIPTGVDPSAIKIEDIKAFRKKWGIEESDLVVGTLCILRGWKGVSDFLHAAKKLQGHHNLKWIVVGGGVSEEHFLQQRKELGLENEVIFTGHIEPPYTALAAMDIFLLLSWANEGVSQASLQAAWLQKPLVTTTIGGLPEVCIEGKTGFLVPTHSPEKVAEAVKRLIENPDICKQMGQQAKAIVGEKFTLEKTLEGMEEVYAQCLGNQKKSA